MQNAEGQELPGLLLHCRWQGKKRGWCTAVSSPGIRQRTVRGYRPRWGIEPAFRQLKRLRIRTSNQHAVLRYLYVLLSVLLYLLYAALRLAAAIAPRALAVVSRAAQQQMMTGAISSLKAAAARGTITLYQVRRGLRALAEQQQDHQQQPPQKGGKTKK